MHLKVTPVEVIVYEVDGPVYRCSHHLWFSSLAFDTSLCLFLMSLCSVFQVASFFANPTGQMNLYVLYTKWINLSDDWLFAFQWTADFRLNFKFWVQTGYGKY